MMYQSSLQTDSRLTSVNQTVSNRILYSESSSSSQSLIEETQQSLETSSLEHQRSQTLEHQYFDPNQVLNREPTNKIISNHFTILSADHRKQNKVESKEELRETANFDPLTKSTYKKILESNERSSDSLIKKQSHNSKNQLTAINHTKSQFNSDTNFIAKSDGKHKKSKKSHQNPGAESASLNQSDIEFFYKFLDISAIPHTNESYLGDVREKFEAQRKQHTKFLEQNAISKESSVNAYAHHEEGRIILEHEKKVAQKHQPKTMDSNKRLECKIQKIEGMRYEPTLSNEKVKRQLLEKYKQGALTERVMILQSNAQEPTEMPNVNHFKRPTLSNVKTIEKVNGALHKERTNAIGDCPTEKMKNLDKPQREAQHRRFTTSELHLDEKAKSFVESFFSKNYGNARLLNTERQNLLTSRRAMNNSIKDRLVNEPERRGSEFGTITSSNIMGTNSKIEPFRETLTLRSEFSENTHFIKQGEARHYPSDRLRDSISKAHAQRVQLSQPIQNQTATNLVFKKNEEAHGSTECKPLDHNSNQNSSTSPKQSSLGSSGEYDSKEAQNVTFCPQKLDDAQSTRNTMSTRSTYKESRNSQSLFNQRESIIENQNETPITQQCQLILQPGLSLIGQLHHETKRNASKPHAKLTIATSFEIDASSLEEGVCPKPVPFTTSKLNTRRKFSSAPFPQFFAQPKLSRTSEVEEKGTRDAFCIDCEEFIPLEEANRHSLECARKLADHSYQVERDIRASLNSEEVIIRTYLAKVEDLNQKIGRIIVKVNDQLRSVGPENLGSGFVDSCKRLIKIAREIVAEDNEGQSIQIKMEAFDVIFGPISSKARGFEVRLIIYLQRLFVILLEKSHLVELNNVRYSHVESKGKSVQKQYQSEMLNEIQKKDAKQMKTLKADELKLNTAALSMISSVIESSVDQSEITQRTTISEAPFFCQSQQPGPLATSEDLRRYFYAEALSYKMTLPPTHQRKDLLISDLYDQCMEKKIPVDSFVEFIKFNFEMF